MKNITKFFILPAISFVVFLMLVMPVISFALDPLPAGCTATDYELPENAERKKELSEGLVQCGRKTMACQTQEDIKAGRPPTIQADPNYTCKFNDVMNLINKIIRFILYLLAIPIIAIMFAYAGILLVTSGGDPGAKTKAKDVFLNAVIGLALAVGAFLIIRTLLHFLGYKGAWIGF